MLILKEMIFKKDYNLLYYNSLKSNGWFLNMKYYDEMKYEEIAEILKTSVGALKASYHPCR